MQEVDAKEKVVEQKDPIENGKGCGHKNIFNLILIRTPMIFKFFHLSVRDRNVNSLTKTVHCI